ncbi:hypothetical protein EGW08_023712 [Elysia chlorotica]|uniref:Uncharacterized protein n=1 Tax=Elysia chlorotica TaxID=188477 RepID=A0A3S1AVN6_ELYCH|nr:hypothetical protein EGW08_023712 [Elysia chlorotica]
MYRWKKARNSPRTLYNGPFVLSKQTPERMGPGLIHQGSFAPLGTAASSGNFGNVHWTEQHPSETLMADAIVLHLYLAWAESTMVPHDMMASSTAATLKHLKDMTMYRRPVDKEAPIYNHRHANLVARTERAADTVSHTNDHQQRMRNGPFRDPIMENRPYMVGDRAKSTWENLRRKLSGYADGISSQRRECYQDLQKEDTGLRRNLQHGKPIDYRPGGESHVTRDSHTSHISRHVANKPRRPGLYCNALSVSQNPHAVFDSRIIEKQNENEVEKRGRYFREDNQSGVSKNFKSQEGNRYLSHITSKSSMNMPEVKAKSKSRSGYRDLRGRNMYGPQWSTHYANGSIRSSNQRPRNQNNDQINRKKQQGLNARNSNIDFNNIQIMNQGGISMDKKNMSRHHGNNGRKHQPWIGTNELGTRGYDSHSDSTQNVNSEKENVYPGRSSHCGQWSNSQDQEEDGGFSGRGGQSLVKGSVDFGKKGKGQDKSWGPSTI